MTAPAPLVQLRQDGELYLPAEVGRLFGVRVRTVADWHAAGYFPLARTPGGHRRYPAGPVNQLLRDRGLLAPDAELPGQYVLPL